jgi:hypothetical protein
LLFKRVHIIDCHPTHTGVQKCIIL